MKTMRVEIITKKDKKGRTTEAYQFRVDQAIRDAKGIQIEKSVYGKNFEIDYSKDKATWWWNALPNVRIETDLIYKD